LKKLISVRILDQEYVLRTDEDEEHVQEVVRFVNDKFSEIMDHTDGLSEKKMAILGAFDIASDYFHLLKEQRDIKRRAHALNSQIDSVLI
jgi:cell division protein ZapA